MQAAVAVQPWMPMSSPLSFYHGSRNRRPRLQRHSSDSSTCCEYAGIAAVKAAVAVAAVDANIIPAPLSRQLEQGISFLEAKF